MIKCAKPKHKCIIKYLSKTENKGRNIKKTFVEKKQRKKYTLHFLDIKILSEGLM
jgi:hypothetical protein